MKYNKIGTNAMGI